MLPISYRTKPISLRSFQDFPPPDPKLPFCGYFLQLSSATFCPAKLNLSVLPTHRYFLSFICSHNPLCLHVPPVIWMPQSHFSRHCRLPTKRSILPFPSPALHSFSVHYPKTLPCHWILRKNQAPFPTSRMRLGSFRPICKFLHPDHRERVNMCPGHSNQDRSQNTSLKYWGSVSSSRARDAQVVSLRIYSCHPPTSQEKEQSW